MSSTYEKIKDDFLIKYKRDIVPLLESLEKDRQEALKKHGKKPKTATVIVSIPFVFAGLIILLISVFPSLGESGKTMMILMRLCVISFIALPFIFLFCPFKFLSRLGGKIKFETKAENELMPIVCSCFGNLKWNTKTNTLEYYEKELKRIEHLESKVKLLPKHESCAFYTPFSGVWNDIAFNISKASFLLSDSVRLMQVIIEMTFYKKFKSHTVVTMDTKKHLSPAKHLQHTELEDVVFEKKFDVFTNDPIEARYLITTAFMERLNNISKVFQGDLYSCAFLDNKFYIALNIHEQFFNIVNINKPLVKNMEIFNLFNQIISIYKLIDYFKKNTTSNDLSINN